MNLILSSNMPHRVALTFHKFYKFETIFRSSGNLLLTFHAKSFPREKLSTYIIDEDKFILI